MTNDRQKVWIVEYNDYETGWEPRGYFTTEDKAKKSLADYIKQESDIYGYASTDFRTDWHYLDRSYYD